MGLTWNLSLVVKSARMAEWSAIPMVFFFFNETATTEIYTY